MNILYEMIQRYPLMSSWTDCTYWTGFVSVQGELVRLAVTVPNFPLVRGAYLSGNSSTQSFCKTFGEQIKAYMTEKNSTLVDLLDSLVSIMEKSEELKVRVASRIEAVDDQFYSTLLAELSKIGLDNAVYSSKDYREIHIKHTDSSRREHIVRYQLQSRYPNVPLKVNTDLPILSGKHIWPCKIVEAQAFFKSQVEQFGEFWKVMDELDEMTRIIDPPKPNRSHTYRRIMVKDRVVLYLEINPLKPKDFPEITFTGPASEVHTLETRLEENCKRWSIEKSILENLQTILQTDFLEKVDAELDLEDDCLKCIVCYMYEMEDKGPARTCECGAQYHNRCLYDLFVNEFSKAGKRCVDCPVCSAELKILVVPP